MKSRRDFLKISATGAVGAAGMALTSNVENVLGATVPLAPGPGNQWPGRVAINFNKNAVTGNDVDTTVLTTMINDAILRLTGKTTLAEAWRSLFPANLTTPPKIAIKVPCGFANPGPPATAPHWAAVKAMTDGLQQMVFGTTTMPAANITVYDWLGFGHGTDTGANGQKFPLFGYTAANLPGIVLSNPGQYDNGVLTASGGARNLAYSNVLANADYLINVFSPRGHCDYAGGVTLGFKNHFGTYDANGHGAPNGGWMTNAVTPPFSRDINCTGPVFNKTVLTVCGGMFGTAENSGDPKSTSISYFTYAKAVDSSVTNTLQSPCTVIMSTDPVSAEFQAIKMMRLNDGGKYTAADMPLYLRASAGDTTALADATYNIGIINESAMDIRRVLNGVTPVALNPEQKSLGGRLRIAASQIRGGNSTFIEYAVPEGRAGTDALISIHDARGALVRSFSARVGGAVNHVSWDETDMNGMMVSRGLYVVRLHAGAGQVSAPVAIVR